MTALAWVQLGVYLVLLIAVTKPLGVYMCRVFQGDRRGFPAPLVRLERLLLRACGVAGDDEQDWKRYTISIFAFSAVGVAVTYALQRLQHVLPLNPQHLKAVPPSLALNTAVSFVT